MASELTAEEIIYVLKTKIDQFERGQKRAGDTAEKEGRRITKAFGQTSNEIERGQKRAADAVEKEGRRITRTFDHISSGANRLIAGLTVGAIALGTKELIRMGDEAVAVRNGFERLAIGAGESADQILQAMRRGTKGTVTDLNLMKQANQALLLGIPATAQQMEELTRAAHRLGQAVGRNTTDAVGDLITGFGRMSIELLDNLGITVRAEEAYAEFANRLGKGVKELTDAERRLAFFTIGMERAKQRADQLGETLDNTTIKAQRASIALQNFGTNFGKSLSFIIQDTLAANNLLGRFLDYLGILGKVQDFNTYVEREERLRSSDPAVQAQARIDVYAERIKALQDEIKTLEESKHLPTVGLKTRGQAIKDKQAELEELQKALSVVETTLARYKEIAASQKQAREEAEKKAEAEQATAAAVKQQQEELQKQRDEWKKYRDDPEREIARVGNEMGRDERQRQEAYQAEQDELDAHLAEQAALVDETIERLGEAYGQIPETFEDGFMESLNNIEQAMFLLSGKGRSFFSGIGQIWAGLKGTGIGDEVASGLTKIGFTPALLGSFGQFGMVASGVLTLVGGIRSLLGTRVNVSGLTSAEDVDAALAALESKRHLIDSALYDATRKGIEARKAEISGPSSGSVSYNQVASITQTTASQMVGNLSTLVALKRQSNQMDAERNAYLRNLEFHAAVSSFDRLTRFSGRRAS